MLHVSLLRPAPATALSDGRALANEYTQAGNSNDTVWTSTPIEDHAAVDEEDPAEEAAAEIATMVDTLADKVVADETLHNTTTLQYLSGFSRTPAPTDQAAMHSEIPTNREVAPLPATETD